MVIYESYGTTISGDELVIAYSDKDVYIERNAVLYESAVDLKKFNYEYIETNIPIAHEDEATVEDYTNALQEVGVEV